MYGNLIDLYYSDAIGEYDTVESNLHTLARRDVWQIDRPDVATAVVQASMFV